MMADCGDAVQMIADGWGMVTMRVAIQAWADFKRLRRDVRALLIGIWLLSLTVPIAMRRPARRRLRSLRWSALADI
jgi:hypothetical protein